MLVPALVTLLREHWLASPHKAPGDLVFCNAKGQGLDYRDVGEGFRAAVKAAGLTGPGRLSLHSLRHTYASLLIAKGLDVVFVSRQLGHASPATTLGLYAQPLRPGAAPGDGARGPGGELPDDDRHAAARAEGAGWPAGGRALGSG